MRMRQTPSGLLELTMLARLELWLLAHGRRDTARVIRAIDESPIGRLLW